MNAWRERILAVGATFLLCACGTSTGNDAAVDAGGSDSAVSDATDVVNVDAASDVSSDARDGTAADGGRTPVNHRASDALCQTVPAAGGCLAMIGECSTDTMCTSGTNGRCVSSTSGARQCRCTYDACTRDTDCATGQLCACHGSPYTGGAGNVCLPGNCRVDANCGANGYCSPSQGTSGCGSVVGYFCHTATDQCTDDADCVGGGIMACMYSSTTLRWECMGRQLCP